MKVDRKRSEGDREERGYINEDLATKDVHVLCKLFDYEWSMITCVD